jgi:hypothetical protein
MATQAYPWALPLVSYAQWQQQHRDVFGAANFDLVHYVSYRDRLVVARDIGQVGDILHAEGTDGLPIYVTVNDAVKAVGTP